VDLEGGVENFHYLPNFPLFTVLNVNFVANFKLPPVPPMLHIVVVTNGPLVSVKFHLNHKNIAIFDSVGVVVNLAPIVFGIALAPQTRIFC
jgi:hypothetical protein